jgi:hypothetical protein
LSKLLRRTGEALVQVRGRKSASKPPPHFTAVIDERRLS